jgi:hypothetical protein
MKETYSLKEVKQVVKDVVTIAFDPNPDADFYVELFNKYDEELQEYITNALLAAVMARKFAELTMEGK